MTREGPTHLGRPRLLVTGTVRPNERSRCSYTEPVATPKQHDASRTDSSSDLQRLRCAKPKEQSVAMRLNSTPTAGSRMVAANEGGSIKAAAAAAGPPFARPGPLPPSSAKKVCTAVDVSAACHAGKNRFPHPASCSADGNASGFATTLYFDPLTTGGDGCARGYSLATGRFGPTLPAGPT